jgi:hypothetical protein
VERVRVGAAGVDGAQGGGRQLVGFRAGDEMRWNAVRSAKVEVVCVWRGGPGMGPPSKSVARTHFVGPQNSCATFSDVQ